MVRFAGGKPDSFEEDTDFDGKPDLRGKLAPDGTVLAEERASASGKGFDTRAVYEGGEKVAEERDTQRRRQGRRGDALRRGPGRRARSRTTNFDGRFEAVLVFENGRQARQETDANGDGKPDAVIVYGAEGKPVREEADRSGDGTIDFRREFAGERARARRSRHATATAASTSSPSTRPASPCAPSRTRTATASPS